MGLFKTKQDNEPNRVQEKDTVIKESHKKKAGKCKIHKEHKRHCVDCEA